MSREKPFSFYQRDLEKFKARKKDRYERQQFVIKANKIPSYCTMILLSKEKEQLTK